MRQICNDACDSALASSESYEHGLTQQWNNHIISSILKALISESASAEDQAPKYKFAVNSTIIQHLSDPRPDGTDGEDSSGESPAEGKKVGRRGMHSASGAYWNNERDGMWSHKYEGGEGKGMDIVISIMWIGV